MKNLTDFRETVETSVDLYLENVWSMKMTICPGKLLLGWSF